MRARCRRRAGTRHRWSAAAVSCGSGPTSDGASMCRISLTWVTPSSAWPAFTRRMTSRPLAASCALGLISASMPSWPSTLAKWTPVVAPPAGSPYAMLVRAAATRGTPRPTQRSGRGAPARAAMPMRTVPSGRMRPGSEASVARSAAPRSCESTTIAGVAPPFTLASTCPAVANSNTTLCPVSRSKAAATSSTGTWTAAAESTRTSAAPASSASSATAPAAIAPSIAPAPPRRPGAATGPVKSPRAIALRRSSPTGSAARRCGTRSRRRAPPGPTFSGVPE